MDPQNGPMFEAPEMQDAGCWHALRHLTSIVSLPLCCEMACEISQCKAKALFGNVMPI